MVNFWCPPELPSGFRIFLSGMFTLLRARAAWTASLHSSCSSALHYELLSQTCGLQVQVIFHLWYNLRFSKLFTASINGCVKVDHQDRRTAVDLAPVSVNDVNHQRTTTADSVAASVNSAAWVTFSCVLLLTFDLFCIANNTVQGSRSSRSVFRHM